MATFTKTFTDSVDRNIDAYPNGAAEWVYVQGATTDLQIIAADSVLKATGFGGGDRAARYTGTGTVTGDQDVTITCTPATSNSYGACARMSAVAATYYLAKFDITQTNEVRLYRVVATTHTLIGSWDDGITAGTHTLRIRVTGSGATISISVQSDSNTIHTFDDTDALRITSGHPGLYGYTDSSTAGISQWVLDDLISAGNPHYYYAQQ